MKTPEEFLADNGFVTAAEIDRQALTASLLACLILLIVFKHYKPLRYVIAAFVASVLILIYVLTLPLGNNWQLFLILAPAEALVFLGFHVRKKPRKR